MQGENQIEINENEEEQQGEQVDLSKMSKTERYRYYYDLLEENYNLAKLYIQNDKSYFSYLEYYREVEEKAKIDFLNNVEKHFVNQDQYRPTKYFVKSSKKVGIICDEFLYNSLKDVVDLHYVSYFEDLENGNYDFDYFIYATAWKGIDDSWKNSASPNNDRRLRLRNFIKNLKSQGIPTIFYSKEDPVNYELFKNVSLECDLIFTSATEMVPKYKKYAGHENVYTLQFGVNPYYHNPIGTRSKFAMESKDEVIFAGSWLQKYPTRNKEAAMILDGVLNAEKPLTIIDRNLELKVEKYLFPDKYIPNLTYPVSHNDLMNIHKLYRWAINLNSVKYSETMFANRIFELQAFGNLLISNYSVGVNNQFPNVFMINNGVDVNPILNNYTEYDYNEFSAKGIRNVFRNHTTFHRINQIEKKLFSNSLIENEKSILVVNQSPESNELANSIDRQLNVNKVVVNKGELNNNLLEEYDFIAFMSEDNIYGEYYLEDLLTVFKYTDVEFSTKSGSGEIHNYISKVTDINQSMFNLSYITDLDQIKQLQNGYLIDHSELENDRVAPKSSKELSVIIPIYNNGIYLEDKCFASLRRSSIFNKMEIIFVNDGSTDIETINIINRLRRKYPNHIVYKEFESGSGSASRPRNAGVKLATSDYITYLDPDNEAMGDGYAKLFEKINQDKSIDLVVGNIMKEDNARKSKVLYSETFKKYNYGNDIVTDTHKFMKESGLRAQSIQALIVKKEIIEKNDINMIEGAAGQDTMFYQELVLNCNKIQTVNTYVHMYYAAVTGSVTNTISTKFFEKYYRLEIQRIPFLKKHNLLKSYMEQRFNFYIKGWYLVRFDRIKPEDRKEAVTKFLDIYSLYDGFDRPRDIELDKTITELKREVDYKKQV